MKTIILMFFLMAFGTIAPAKDKQDAKKSVNQGSRTVAADDCSKRKTIFGKIIAICGDRNVVYAGTQKLPLLGAEYIAPVFELTTCQGGLRLTLNARAHSEGFELKLAEPHVLKYGADGKPELSEQISISHAWGRFAMNVQQSNGTSSQVSCERYEDKRGNFEYLQ